MGKEFLQSYPLKIYEKVSHHNRDYDKRVIRNDSKEEKSGQPPSNGGGVSDVRFFTPTPGETMIQELEKHQEDCFSRPKFSGRSTYEGSWMEEMKG